MTNAFRWISLAIFLFAGGCATSKTITINTKPADATIKINGIDVGRGQTTQQFNFDAQDTTHTVTVLRLGFRDESVTINRDFNKSTLNVELKPLRRMVSINVAPAAVLSIDGQRITDSPVDAISKELEFTVDARNNWIPHTVTAERAGYAKAEKVIAFQDKDDTYTISLEPQKKDLHITTNPPGASIYLDGELLGNSPLTVPDQKFAVDPASDKPIPRKLRAHKQGFDPVDREIGWDNGKTDYLIDLAAKSKMVRIITDPPGAVVTIDGKELEQDANKASLATLEFPPVGENGELKTYEALVSKKTEESEWIPTKLVIGWDEGKNDYTVTLAEVKTRPVPLLQPVAHRTENGWEIVPETSTTIAMKDVTEGPQKEPPTQISKLPRGTQIDTIALSPNSGQILFTILSGAGKADFRSQMMVVKSDGSEAADFLSDGQSLDIMPAFTPTGDEVVFSSNRAGTRMKIWSMSATGAPGIMQLTTGETNDLWPIVDSDPKPRLFYQALVDNRPDPRIYKNTRNTTTLTDLPPGGLQPRVSPRGNQVIFTVVNEKTSKRDLCVMPDGGGSARNLTNTPDIDEFDPSFNKDGSKIAFVSDAGVDEDNRRNYDLWIMELAHPDKPVQVTFNGSYDDHPVWDLRGNFIFFRSNRGGEWAIWRLPVNQPQAGS